MDAPCGAHASTESPDNTWGPGLLSQSKKKKSLDQVPSIIIS